VEMDKELLKTKSTIIKVSKYNNKKPNQSIKVYLYQMKIEALK
jgi:hypothetical protein